MASVAVSREHRRAKTDRLDIKGLKRVYLGWLRGEREHCKMVAIPTLAEEDAKRPYREREALVGEQTTIINRMKATLTRLGIRNFNPKLKKAPERLEHVRTPEGDTATFDGIPFASSTLPGRVVAPGPLLGEHTDLVLRDLLGLREADIAALRAEGVIA